MKALVTGSISSLNSLKDKTIKVVLHLQELPPQETANIFSLQNEYAKIYISTESILEEAQTEIDSLKMENDSKSPSKRMRDVLFVLWKQDKLGYEDFEFFYNWRMNQLIEKLKEKLV